MIKYIILSVLLLSCTEAQKQGKGKEYTFKGKYAYQYNLDSRLDEISGFALNSEGRLFTHNDELGIIYELNSTNGKILKKFQVGTFGIEGDFEGLDIAGNKFYLLESDGKLYQFEEGKENEKVDFKLFETPFSNKYEFEGICFAPDLKGLLLTVKEYSGKKYGSKLPVFLFSLETYLMVSEPLFFIDLKDLKKNYDIDDFYPSGIAISPISGNYFIISSKGSPVIIESDTKGNILDVNMLDKSIHKQPEAVTILTDGSILIGDEKVKKAATLTKYSIHKK
ncbi:MAG: SdiA-regulated domain-containing protein [Bacteroidetes bacterium]|nr:SdiA-regulated domain-containing protein [Bacteroidota bacterium]